MLTFLKVNNFSRLYLTQALLIFNVYLSYCQDFITQWSFPSAATQIRFNALTTGAVNYTWSASPSGNSGNGSFTKTTAGAVTLSGLNIPVGNIVTLNFAPTNLRRFYINNGIDKLQLTDVLQWGIVPWTSMYAMFSGCSNLNITANDNPNLTNVSDMSLMFFNASSFNQDIGDWDISNIIDLGGMFYGSSSFNQNIGGWNTTNVINMEAMFYGATSFNQNIGGWNTTNVSNMNYLFAGANSFNQEIGSWNTTNVIKMEAMFYGATSFNQNIGSWNTSNVEVMFDMFLDATSFNKSINGWNTIKVNNMSGMFAGASSFNQDIGNWNTSNVFDMSYMFNEATSFNQDIGNWNTSNVELMSGMFANATSFNQNIGNWNTSNVFDMNSMFANATDFNQFIGDWDLSNLTFMPWMFNNASSFNQNLGSWTFNQGVNIFECLSNSGMNCDNYSATLIGWQINNPTLTGIFLGADGLQYGTSAVAARNTLINTQGWTITGDSPSGFACDALLPVELLTFKLQQFDENVLLIWQTTNELNNDYFDIQESTDGIHFVTIGRVKENQVKSEMNYYEFLHKGVKKGTHYYRLKQIDLDGHFSYSKIIFVQLGKLSNETIELFPNPTTGRLNIANCNGAIYNIKNIMGKTIESGSIENGEIFIDNLSEGIYLISINANNKTFTEKIVKI